jgi:hypothetical protein
MNILRVKMLDEVVKRCKCRKNEGLNPYVILWWILENAKTTLEDPKNPFNNIAS